MYFWTPHKENSLKFPSELSVIFIFVLNIPCRNDDYYRIINAHKTRKNYSLITVAKPQNT